MFLKELELVGFKSFPEKTKLKFEPGITAIVGPNGCGKSNIFDSIRWVLGEQSTKALRGTKMEDVIFNGTDNKSPLGMAEVSLVFSNQSRRLSIDSDEIEICRRIFRSGESQYLLNKAPVRLKDISELFMGTGIGAESYSLVEQGKISLVLSTRPEERRLIFDEASGITKYKAQKKEALRKLEETEQNFLRINDIITEVKREINSLERQVNKARRYKEAFEELKNKEVVLANLEVGEIKLQEQSLSSKASNAQNDINSCEEKISNINAKITQSLGRIQQVEQDLADYNIQLINLDNLINNNTQRIEMNGDRTTELKSRIGSLKDQLQEAQARIETARGNLENFQKEYDALKGVVQQKEELLSKRQKEYEEADTSITSFEAQIKQTKGQILDLTAVNSRIKNDISDLQATLKSHILRKKRLDLEKIKSQEEKDNLNQLLGQEILQLGNMEQELGQIQESNTRITDELSNDSSIQEGLLKDIQSLEKEKITLQSQQQFLRELKLKYEDISQSFNAVVYLNDTPGENVSGMVIRVNEAPSRIDPESENLPQNFNYRLKGEAKQMPLDTQAIEKRLEQIGVEIDKKQLELQTIEARMQQLNQEQQDLAEKIKSQEITISNKNLQKTNITEQLDRINQEYEVVGIELQEIDEQITQLNTRQHQLESSLSQNNQQQQQQEEKISSSENSINESRALREETLIDITQIKTEIDNLGVRFSQQEKTHALLENTCRESEALFKRYEEEVEESLAKIGQLSQECGQLQEQNNSAQGQKVEVAGLKEKQQLEFKQLSQLQQQDNAQLGLCANNAEDLRTQMHQYQMQMKEFDFKRRSIKDRINQVYKFDLDEVSSALGPVFDENKDALTERINELKRKVDSMGTVNLIAIEEYEELKKRYDFLTQQRDDLEKARNSLHDAIAKINRTTRQMFLDAFKMIQIEFRNYFRLLFGGGEAQIILTEESKPLESGIEMICRPPGKKLQNVLALSGGEKSLAAVALIFAIFKVKPAPFCVLDEVDAALDEANISRFSTMLQEFTANSQFLVITHSKRTIANADVMYGITMQEPGISKIVSVKLSSVKA